MTVLADPSTRIVVQGITGREAVTFTRHMLDYGSQVVAGVTPGKGGTTVYGVPVYDSLAQALREHPAEASVISVPPAAVREAALEALEHGLRLLVIVTERIPRRDVAEVIAWARHRGARIIGPNSLGILLPGKVKIGMVGGPAQDVRRAYTPGPVAVLSRSGGMTTELASLLTQSGLGQSICVSIGGDPLVGTTFVDLMPLLEGDPDTRAVVVFGEPGGVQEEALAEYVATHRPRLPVVAFLAGRFVDRMPGQRFGHAAVLVEGDRGRVESKERALRAAGVLVAERLSEVPALVREALDRAAKEV
jgi:succinyl-CoA synthetase alpha subunit